ncbi:hypothetical protein I603_0079 [Erythrobacter dokdonensis DSW-74]|uniref:Uncharacterized protein n=1 Tax=Erythrobacter dokdonensis DSW-74 TaxID=1300349 RepID=A0A1A7BHC1_9SPHN|nr:hypothetical protein I603_0079 [Erythrobacter dokdonensis DSW-74]
MRAVGVHLNSCPVRGYDARARWRVAGSSCSVVGALTGQA